MNKKTGIAIVATGILAAGAASLVSSKPSDTSKITVIRQLGKVGIRVERFENNEVITELDSIINGEIRVRRNVTKGSDVFDNANKPERKTMRKERPQPASVKPLKVKVVR